MSREVQSDEYQLEVKPSIDITEFLQVCFPLVYIIVLNWNGLEDTDECLDSLLGIRYQNYVITVIDNGSSLNEANILEEKYRGLIKTIRNDVNLGFVGGMNIGIEYAIRRGADYILLLNNDIIVDREFVNELIKAAEEDRDTAILGPKIYNYNSPTQFNPPLKIDFIRGKFPRKKKLEKLISTKNREVDWVSGCAMMIRAEAITKVGLLDPSFFIYTNDIDYAVRVRKAGYSVVWVPKAKIWHKVGASTKAVKSLYLKYDSLKNKLLFERKHANTRELLMFLFYFIFVLIPSFSFRPFLKQPIDTLRMILCIFLNFDFHCSSLT